MPQETYKYSPADGAPDFEMLPVEIEKSEESWMKLYLEDGSILKAKLVVSKVARSIDRGVPGRNGEPLYHIQSGMIVLADHVPEELRFKDEE